MAANFDKLPNVRTPAQPPRRSRDNGRPGLGSSRSSRAATRRARTRRRNIATNCCISATFDERGASPPTCPGCPSLRWRNGWSGCVPWLRTFGSNGKGAAYENWRVLPCAWHWPINWDSVRADVPADACCASADAPIRCSDNTTASPRRRAAIGRSGEPADGRAPHRYHPAVQDSAKGADC
jgi:hypothetical protein